MQLVIDVNTHQAIQGIGLGSPVNSIGFKSQDTPALNVYFVDRNTVLDLSTSPVLKFGLNLPPPAAVALLVLDTAFTRQTDASGDVFYQGFPVFNTTNLIAALGSNTFINCVGEVRYQLSDGEIVHTLDIPFTIYRTLLVESGSASPVGTESYPPVNSIELVLHKGQPNGYAGLDGAGLLDPLVIPIDGTTITIVSGKLVASGSGGGGTTNLTDFETTTGATLIHSALGVLNRIIAGTGITFDVATTPGGIIISASGGGGGGIASLTDAETTTGLTLISSAAGVLKRLVAGTGVTLDSTTTTGAIIISSTGSGGSGVAALSDAISTGQTLIQSTSGTLKRLIAGSGIAFDAITTAGGVILNSNLADAETSAGVSFLASAGFLKRIIAGTNITLDISTTTGGIIINAAGAALTDAETTTGLSIIASTAGVLKRLVAGTNITIDSVTTPGAIIINGAAGGATNLTDAETTSGQSLISSSGGILKRLIPGTNVTLDVSTTTGAIIINATAGGAGVAAISDAETTTGSTLIAATSGVIKRLVAGTNVSLDTTTTTGAIIINDTSAAALPPMQGIEIWDDFVGNTNGTPGDLGWTYGSNAAAQTFPTVVTGAFTAATQASGGFDMNGGTASPSRSTFTLGAGFGANMIIPRLGILLCIWRVWIPTINSAANATILRCGVFNDDGAGGIQDGVFVSYSHNVSANWLSNCFNGAAATTTASTLAVTAGAWHKLQVLTDATWANITFSVDGTALPTLTTNVPANTKNLTLRCDMAKVAGATNHSATFDYAYLKYAYTTSVR